MKAELIMSVAYNCCKLPRVIAKNDKPTDFPYQSIVPLSHTTRCIPKYGHQRLPQRRVHQARRPNRRSGDPAPGHQQASPTRNPSKQTKLENAISLDGPAGLRGYFPPRTEPIILGAAVRLRRDRHMRKYMFHYSSLSRFMNEILGLSYSNISQTCRC